MLNQADTEKAIRGLRNIARKEKAGGDADAALAEALGVEQELVERIALGGATKGDYLAAAAALEQMAKSLGEPDATTATKSSFGGEQINGESDDNRDAFGRSIVKLHGSSPADIRARKEGRVSLLDEGDGRDAQGRQLKKVYG